MSNQIHWAYSSSRSYAMPSSVHFSEPLHEWVFNEFTGILLREGDSLKLKILKEGKEPSYSKLPLVEGVTLEESIAIYKICKMEIQDGTPAFFPCHHTTEISNKEVSIVLEGEQWKWNVFCKSTGNSSFFDPRNIIPSSRCSQETIALIENIKENIFSQESLKSLKEDFIVTRIFNKEILKKEVEEANNFKWNPIPFLFQLPEKSQAITWMVNATKTVYVGLSAFATFNFAWKTTYKIIRARDLRSALNQFLEKKLEASKKEIEEASEWALARIIRNTVLFYISTSEEQEKKSYSDVQMNSDVSQKSDVLTTPLYIKLFPSPRNFLPIFWEVKAAEREEQAKENQALWNQEERPEHEQPLTETGKKNLLQKTISILTQKIGAEVCTELAWEFSSYEQETSKIIQTVDRPLNWMTAPPIKTIEERLFSMTQKLGLKKGYNIFISALTFLDKRLKLVEERVFKLGQNMGLRSLEGMVAQSIIGDQKPTEQREDILEILKRRRYYSRETTIKRVEGEITNLKAKANKSIIKFPGKTDDEITKILDIIYEIVRSIKIPELNADELNRATEEIREKISTLKIKFANELGSTNYSWIVGGILGVNNILRNVAFLQQLSSCITFYKNTTNEKINHLKTKEHLHSKIITPSRTSPESSFQNLEVEEELQRKQEELEKELQKNRGIVTLLKVWDSHVMMSMEALEQLCFRMYSCFFALRSEFTNSHTAHSSSLITSALNFACINAGYPVVKWLAKKTKMIAFDFFRDSEWNKKLHNIREKTAEVRDVSRKIEMFWLQNPVGLEIEPRSVPSQLDPKIRISKFVWAISVIAYNGSSGNHTQIIIEGLNDGFYVDPKKNLIDQKKSKIKFLQKGEKFINKIDFNPVVSELIETKNLATMLKQGTRTRIWLKTATEVKKMFANIHLDILNPPKYSPLGAYSFFSRGKHNCFTWAKKHLQALDIDFQTSPLDLFIAIPRSYIEEDHSARVTQEL